VGLGSGVLVALGSIVFVGLGSGVLVAVGSGGHVWLGSGVFVGQHTFSALAGVLNNA